MISRNTFLKIPKTLWRILKIDEQGKLWFKESTTPIAVNHVPQIKEWKKLEKGLSDLPPAYVDILFLEDGFWEPPTENVLIKILNSDARIILPDTQKAKFQNLLLKIGYQSDSVLTSSPQFLVFRKNSIPCCGS